jgi:anti-sigma-K factor RskA
LNKEEFISSGLLELYAMQISSPEETQIVEETLKQYPELKQELDDIEISLEKYAQANAIEPSDSAKEKIMNRIFAEDAKEENQKAQIIAINKKSSIPMFYRWITAASIILLIGSIILNYNYYEKYHDTQKDLQAAQQKIEQQEKSNLAMSQDMDIVTNKYAQAVLLKGTAKAPDAVAKIFWMKNTGDVYINPTNLPQAPAGKQYQLWAIVDGKPVDGGMIVTEKGTYHIQKMKSFGKAQAFAITLEKAGGSPTPTMSEMVVIAKM